MAQWKIEVKNFLTKIIGNTNVENIYKKICVSRYKKAGLVFIHIPRAAGSSIAKATVGQRAGHFTAKEIKDELGEEKFNTLFKFSVVRNPYDRLVSSYHYAKQGGGEHGGIERNPIYASPTFETFERFVLEWLIDQDLHKLDYVFRPQNTFIYHGDRLLVDFVGRVEEMGDVEQKLSDVLEKKIVIGNRNKSKRNRDFKKYYTDDIYEAVTEIYKKDIELFNYTF